MSKNPFDYRSFDHHLGNKRYRNITQIGPPEYIGEGRR